MKNPVMVATMSPTRPRSALAMRGWVAKMPTTNAAKAHSLASPTALGGRLRIVSCKTLRRR